MKLAYWMYAGPAHIGTLRIASSFKNVHAIMHAPLGDDYFNVMRSMLERERDFTPVTASIVDRHVLARGSQEKVIQNITRKEKEEKPDLIILTPTCTSSILQEDLHNFVEMAKTTIQSNFLVQKTLNVSSNNSKSKPQTLDHNSDVNVSNNSLLAEGFLDASKNQELPPGAKQGLHKPYGFAQTGASPASQTNKDSSNQLAESNVCDVLLADVNHYRVNELQAADRTLEQIVRFYIEKEKKALKDNIETAEQKTFISKGVACNPGATKTAKPSANIIGIFTLGFHHQHDCRELKRLLHDCGIEINEILPEGCSVHNIKNLSRAWFNIVPYRELGLMTALYLEKECKMPYISTTPMGLVDTSNFLEEIQKTVSKIAQSENINQMDLSACSNLFNVQKYIQKQTLLLSGAAWFSRSIDCQNLTGKKAVVFGDATHAASMTKILAREMGIRVACAGTYCKHDSDWFREQVQGFCDQILITDDHTQVGDIIAELQPSAIFGTQMERHVGKRLDIPCGVISPPIHIQNFPLGYRPFLGYEGANQIADLVYNSFNLGMEDHLLSIFGGHDTKEVISKSLSTTTDLSWSPDGLAELNKIPGFVRGKVKRNTEKFAIKNSIKTITVDVLFAAKEAVGV
jgi:light-independent protochlorophyllide reductase subunit B